jgi:NAD(P)-dependent dehydrogenase (short-subunit alcohol dehydrogenase family)
MSPEPLKTALVTGAARRIGRAIALDLARHGWAVAVHCHRSEPEARAVVGLIEQGGGRAALVQADLARKVEAETLVPRTAAALGPITCLVNNASTFELDLKEDPDDWDAEFPDYDFFPGR